MANTVTTSEITLLEACRRMANYRRKKEPLRFRVTFDDSVDRTAFFSKKWSTVHKEWLYIITEGNGSPSFAYGEREAVSAILDIGGMKLHGAKVDYHVFQEGDDGNG